MNMHEGTMTISKENLLRILNENREAHLKYFEEACEGYALLMQQKLQEMRKALDENASAFRHRKFFEDIHYPESYIKNYDKAIRKIRLTETDDGRLRISDSQYERWVEDEWGWKGKFIREGELPHSAYRMSQGL
jgi:hypothetical protein